MELQKIQLLLEPAQLIGNEKWNLYNGLMKRAVYIASDIVEFYFFAVRGEMKN